MIPIPPSQWVKLLQNKSPLGRASTSVIYQTYATAINGRQYGYGCAMSVTLVVVLLLVALVQVKGLKSKEVQA